MSLFQWLRRHPSKNPVSRPAPRRRPRFDLLEDRLAPAVLTVNSNLDITASNTALTLREAIAIVNAQSTAGFTQESAQITGSLGDNDTIRFAPSLNGKTITLNPALRFFSIEKAVQIIGPGPDQLTVDGNGSNGVFAFLGSDVFALSGLTITGGDATSASGATEPIGGAIYTEVSLTIDNCAITSNAADQGGGIANFGTLTIRNSTLNDNDAMFGGGIYNQGSLTVVNSTLSGNFGEFGGGIAQTVGGSMTVNNSTFAENVQIFAGGGIYVTGGTVVLNNTLLANPTSDIDGSVTVTGSNNFIAHEPTSGGLVHGQNGNIVPNPFIDPSTIIGPLQDNGGSTHTHLLLPGSPAIDKGSNGLIPNGVSTDQRGAGRIAGLAVDIGAVELVTFDGDLVVSTADDIFNGDYSAGNLSLREAVLLANFRSGPDIITFTVPSVTLTNGELELTDTATTTLQGGSGGVTIARNSAEGTPQFRILKIAANARAALAGLTLTNGNVAIGGSSGPESWGGAIFNDTGASLTITGSVVSANTANFAGAVLNYGTMEITGSTFSGNSTSSSLGDAAGAGAIYNGGTLTITNSTLSNNSAIYAGAIFNLNATLNVTGSTFTGNSANTDAGAVYNSGNFNVTNSTFSGNTANRFGGAILSTKPTTIINCTLTNNRAEADGGTEGMGGAIYAPIGDTVLHNTIVAGNFKGSASGASVADDMRGYVDLVFDSSFNLIGDAATSGDIIEGLNGNKVGINGAGTRPIDTILNITLADNGGLTKTHALVAGSPALNAGSNDKVPAGVSTDQRGQPRFVESSVDIGAVEGLATPLTVSIADGLPGLLVLVGQKITYTLTFNRDIDEATVAAADFNNFGTAAISLGAITEPSPGVFMVEVTPTTAGTVRLRIPSTAIIADTLGQNLVVPVVDTDTVTAVQMPVALVVGTGSDVVDGNISTGNLSLREAVLLANAHAGADTITFAQTVPVVTLATGELLFTDAAKTSVLGSGVTISRSTAGGTPEFRILNIAGGASVELASVALTNGKGFSGGGILNAGTLVVADSTISSNFANLFGGGIYNLSGSLKLINSTVSQNSTNSLGGGINSDSTIEIINSTITLNRVLKDDQGDQGAGGGVAINTLPGRLTILQNTIVAGNLRGAGAGTPNDVHRYGSGTLNSSSFNLIGDAVTAGGLVDGQNGNIVGNNGAGTRDIATILNTTLANNGGKTPTHKLTVNSPAINKGSNVLVPAGVTTDQSGQPRISGSAVDIGAVEFPSLTVNFAAGVSGTSVFVSQPIPYTITFNRDVSESQVAAAGINNAGGAAITLGTITKSSPGVFKVNVTPTSAGSIILRIPSTATIVDTEGSPLAVPALDNDTLTAVVFSDALVVSTSDDVVDNDFSTGHLSLREAILIANTRAGADTITFSPALTGKTVTLTGGELAIRSSVTLTGLGAKLLTISGNGAGRIFNVDDGISGLGVTAVISSMTLTGSLGGAVANREVLRLEFIELTNNSASSDGGGIFNTGNLAISSSTMTGNSAGRGGAIFNAASGVLTAINSTFSGNQSSGFGAAIFGASASNTTLVNCTIVGNSGNEAIFKAGDAAAFVLQNTILAGNVKGTDVPSDANGVFTGGNNLIGDPASAGGFVHGTNGNIVGKDADNNPATPRVLLPLDEILKPLADNGGPTKTHELVQNSLAIAAAASGGTIPATDQRGTIRDSGAYDIGAYEVQQPLAPVGVPATYEETFQPRPSADATEAFLKGLYQSTLLRAPSAQEIADWKAVMATGVDKVKVAFGFVNSVENRSSQVTFFYNYFLGRTPDPVGLAGWVRNLQLGQNEADVMSGFLLSTEFTGQNDDTSFVNLMYYAVLGRQADPAGLDGWIDQLADGTSTREQVGDGFLFSTESLVRVVASTFRAYLKRGISDADAAVFAGQIARGEKTFGQVAADLLGSDEFLFWAGQNLN